MHVEFLLGRAGSGKTFRCLRETRLALERSADGLPLLFIAPKQATYQLERQLLGTGLGRGSREAVPLGNSGQLSGYTRLRIVSFERLARWIFALAGRPEPQLLNEERRVMVLPA